jgi:hypothetical protein
LQLDIQLMDILISHIFLYFIFILLLHNQSFLQNIPNAFALSPSPSFERQEINDMETDDWIFWRSNNEEKKIISKDGDIISIPTATNKLQCTFHMHISPDIKSVSYLSNDNRLNATIWVSSKLLDNVLLKNDIDGKNFNSTSFLPLWHNLKFTMAIDIFSIFNEGIDYRVDLFGEKVNSTHSQWKKEVYEISADGTNKRISNQTFDRFPFGNKEFVDFSVDLKSISNPQKYRILFYITDLYVKDGKLCRLVDSTNWALSPPPEFNIIVSPNSIFMRPGDDKDITVTINGNTELQSKGRLNVTSTDKKDADVNFLSNETVISSFANGSSILHIGIPNSEVHKSKHLIIPIDANISFPTTIINKNGETFYNNKSISLLKHSNVVLTVLPSFTWTERLAQFAETLKPIGELWYIFAPIGTAIITLAFYFHRKRTNENKGNTGNRKINEF